MTLLSQHYMMLNRNQLYTGMTRVKKLLIIAGSRKAIEMAVENFRPEVRYTRLLERIKNTAAGLDCQISG